MIQQEKIFLCLDPGKINFGFSFLSNSNGVLQTGYLNPIQDFNEFELPKYLGLFEAEIRQLLKTYPLEYVVAERFQYRGAGGGKGAVGEYINFMLGVIATLCKQEKVKLFLINAGVWKGMIQRVYGTNDMEKLLANKFTVHECDSVGMGIFTIEQYEYAERGSMIPKILGRDSVKGKLSKEEAIEVLKKAVAMKASEQK